ncbi:unnamed protein product [Amoebophrya sp. A120]|nr:unnamed protein product [Amoebophrya sp. A120]|eukprot:GSA120T00024888001.1
MNNMAGSLLEIRNLVGKSCTITVDTAKVKKVADLCSWSIIEKLFDEDQLLPPLHRIKWFVCANATTTVPGSKASKDSAASEVHAERLHGDRNKEEYSIGEEEPSSPHDHSPKSNDAGRGSFCLSERSRSRSPRREQQDEPQMRVAEKDEDVIFGDDVENPVFYQFAVVAEEFSVTWETYTPAPWESPEAPKSKRPWADFPTVWQGFVACVIGQQGKHESWWKLHEVGSFIYDQTWLAMIDDGSEAKEILANCHFPIGPFPPLAEVFGDLRWNNINMLLPPKLCFELLDLPLTEWRKHARASGGKAFTDDHRMELATRVVHYRFTRKASEHIHHHSQRENSETAGTHAKLFRRALEIASPGLASVVGMLEPLQSGRRLLEGQEETPLCIPAGMQECVSALLAFFGTRGEARHFCDELVESVFGVAAVADRWRKQAAQGLQQQVLAAARTSNELFHLLREQVELFLLPLGNYQGHSGRTRVNQALKWLQMLKEESDKMQIDHGLDGAIKDLERLYSRLDFSEAGGSLRDNVSGLQVFQDLGLATHFRDAMQESRFLGFTEERPFLVNNQMLLPFTWNKMVGSLRDVVDVKDGHVTGIW